MTKKIKKGQPIEELVKGSLDYTMNAIREAFRAQFPYMDNNPSYYIEEMFAGHVIVRSFGEDNALKADEYYMVTYEQHGDSYTFAARDAWEIVELAYQPQTKVTNESKEKGGKRFEERMECAAELMEAVEGKPRRVRFKGAMTADIVNGNDRRYPASVLQAAVEELTTHLHESAGQGRAVQVLGEAEHPSDKSTRRANLLETVTKWDEVSFDGQNVSITGSILETSKGRDILTLMEGGVMPGVSMRGYGNSKIVKEGGERIEEVLELHITGFDLVLEPSFENVAELLESITSMEDDMSEELLTKLQEQEQDKAALAKKLEEAQTAIEEKASLEKELAERKAADAARAKEEEVAKAIAEVTKELPFGEKLNALFVEAIQGGEYANAEAVKKFAEAKRKEYGSLAAAGMLRGMGFDEKNQRFEVIGDVLEEETGTPEFARPAFEITESMARREMRERRDLQKGKDLSRAEVLTKQILERFDALHKVQLMKEARMFQEAELTTDLDLPYSVSRAIIEEAFPSLVAANIFDTGVINTSPTKLYFEVHTAETGYTATATAEVVTGGAEETWYDLTYGRVTPGTVTVTSNPAGTTYTENTDFVIDYAAGRIKFLTAGSIDTNDVLVTYTYTAMRQGENAEIERAKVTLSSMTVEAAADRLADYISREAIVFSRSQLGYDVVSRALANLIRQTQRKIDQGMLYMALAAVKSVASNSGGTWTTGNDEADYDDLARLIGETKVKLANRYYPPNFALMSLTNAEDLSNWRGFKRDGFPNAVLNAAGYAGNVKGLPIFASTEFPSDTIIIGSRELVMYRVFQPMIVRGPFPTYGANRKLVAAEQYYTEEFNVTESPVEEKGTYLTVAAGS